MTRRIRLSIEGLNDRELPSALLLHAAPPVGGQVIQNNQAPRITDFKAVVGPNGQVTISGTVTDDQPVAGYAVQISGDGINLAAIVQADGTFQVTAVFTGNSDVTVMAQVTDAQGATSDPVYTTFTPSA
jgi:hypothetical protein